MDVDTKMGIFKLERCEGRLSSESEEEGAMARGRPGARGVPVGALVNLVVLAGLGLADSDALSVGRGEGRGHELEEVQQRKGARSLARPGVT
eukprot:1194780-Rhodomonas_salina.1